MELQELIKSNKCFSQVVAPKWKLPKESRRQALIQVTDANHQYYKAYGYIIGSRDNESAIYIPVYKSTGFSCSISNTSIEIK